MHILDIVQNAITAEATLIQITIEESSVQDFISIQIEDNGRGMSNELLKNVTDPFTTTRTTRKVGLGIPLFKLAAEQANGNFSITSAEGVGTIVCASMQQSHIDRSPIGDMAGTFLGLLAMNEHVDFVYTHSTDKGKFEFDTREAKKILGGGSLAAFEVAQWISDYMNEGLAEIGAEKY